MLLLIGSDRDDAVLSAHPFHLDPKGGAGVELGPVASRPAPLFGVKRGNARHALLCYGER